MKVIQKCPVCFSNNLEYKYKGKDLLHNIVKDIFSIYSCRKCGAFFLNPYPTQAETSKFYPKTYYAYSVNKKGGFFEYVKDKIIYFYISPGASLSLMDRFLVQLFKNKFSGIPLYKKKNGTFLDIGCGIGSNMQILEKYGWKTWGIELEKNAVAFARKQGLNVKQISFEKINFGRQKFDCIRIWHVFEHLTDPHFAMKKLKRLLKDDGEILMALPNTDSFAQRLFRSYWYGLDTPRHIINYSPKTLNFLTQKHGLKIKEIQYASAGALIGSVSHFIRSKYNYRGNLINSLPLVLATAPFDFIADLLHQGDTIFLRIIKD